MRLIDADAFWAQFEEGENKLSFMKSIFPPEIIDVTLKIYAELKERLDSMPVFEPQKWIPVSERLPSDHERYLLTEEVHYTTGRIIRRVLVAFYDDENEEWYEEMGEDVEVVSYPLAWRPLPEPYQPKEEKS